MSMKAFSSKLSVKAKMLQHIAYKYSTYMSKVQKMRLAIQTSCKQVLSMVKILNSVTILWLTCFDHWFNFYDPLNKLAPRSLAKVPAFFVTWQHSKWPPTPTLLNLCHLESSMKTFFHANQTMKISNSGISFVLSEVIV